MNNEDISRVERFRQFKNEIRGSDRVLIVGLDIGKNMHHGFLGTATGKTVKRGLRVENSARGFEHLLTSLRFYMDRDGFEDSVFGLEPTSVYHKPLAEFLISHGHLVVYVTNEAIKKNRALLDGRWDKNDTKDAANVADLVSRGRCLYYDLPSQEIVDLRALLSLRRRLKKEEHSLRMRIRNGLLAQYFPELDRFYNACESENLAIVRWCLNPDKIAAMEFAQFFKMVTRTRRGIAQKLRLEKIYQAAIDSVGCPMRPAAEFEAELLVEKLNQVRGQVHDTEELIEDICLTFSEYSYLLTIPGFGPYISAKMLAAIADPFRFDNRKQVVKMAGYDLCANRSGKSSDKAVPVISKNGNGELRYALYQAANVAAAKTDHFRAYFTKMLQGRDREKGIKTKMKVKLAVKMLVIAWTLMKKKEVFDPDHLNID